MHSRLAFPLLLAVAPGVAAQAALPQPDLVSLDDFEAGLAAIEPRELWLPPGYSGPGPGSSGLRVVLSAPVATDTFVAIASSDPRLVVPGGGAVVPAGNSSGTFLLADGGSAGGATPIVLTATLGAMRRYATVRISTSANETNAVAEADFCNIQFPPAVTVAAGAVTPLLYGQLYEAGATEAPGAPAAWLAQVGFGIAGTDPRDGGWAWSSAPFNAQVGNNDEFAAVFTAPAAPGVYRYAFRFSNDLGASWTHCDLNGAGSNAGLTFEPGQAGTMTVQ